MMLFVLAVADVDMIWKCSVPCVAGALARVLAAADPAPLSIAATETAPIAAASVLRMFPPDAVCFTESWCSRRLGDGPV
jgi:hypothetical protein